MASTLATSRSPTRRSKTQLQRPSSRLLVFLGICVIPPLLLLLIFGDRPRLVSTTPHLFPALHSVGPIILLRHARHQTLLQMNETLRV